MNKRQIKKLYDQVARGKILSPRLLNVVVTEQHLTRIERIRNLPKELWTKNGPPFMGKYITQQGRVFRADLKTTATWFSKGDRTVDHTTIGDARVSTV